LQLERRRPQRKVDWGHLILMIGIFLFLMYLNRHGGGGRNMRGGPGGFYGGGGFGGGFGGSSGGWSGGGGGFSGGGASGSW
jgi:uncharacterized protein